MSTYSSYSSSYQAEERLRDEERKNAPKECPHCHTSINANLGRWERVRYHCGRDACRQAVSRTKRAERLRQDRANTRERIYQYCNTHLTADERRAVMDVTDQVMSYNQQEGHTIAQGLVNVIEAHRCKHDNIKVLIDNAAISKRRQERTVDFALEQEALYLRRIAELEAEIKIYQSLEYAVYQVALDQERKQPDPAPRPPVPPMPEEEAQEAADHQHTLERLRGLGIKPLSDMTPAELAALDGEEESGGWLPDDEKEGDEEDEEGSDEEDEEDEEA